MPLLRFADLEKDVALIEQARDAADDLLATRSGSRRSAISRAGSAGARRSSAREALLISGDDNPAPARPAGYDDRGDRSEVRTRRRPRSAARTLVHRRTLERGPGVDARGRQRAVERHPERPHAALVGRRRHDACGARTSSSRTATRATSTARCFTAVTDCAPCSARSRTAARSASSWIAGRASASTAPNDIVVKSDGTLWFTDPPYGLIIPEEGHGGESEIGDCLVFRHDPKTGALDPVTDLPIEPNGLAFSPDERRLYVSDTSAALGREATGEHCIWVFDVVGRQPSRERTQVRRRDPGRSRRVPRRRAGLDLHELGGQRAGVPSGRQRCWAGFPSPRRSAT